MGLRSGVWCFGCYYSDPAYSVFNKQHCHFDDLLTHLMHSYPIKDSFHILEHFIHKHRQFLVFRICNQCHTSRDSNSMDRNDMKFRIVYDGPALDSNEMEIRDLAPALIALSGVFEEATKTVYGKDLRMSVKVNASFRAGSFGVDLVASSTSFAQNLIQVFSSNPTVAAANIITLIGFGCAIKKPMCNGLIQFIKWLNGRKIKRIHPLPDSDVQVFIDDDSMVVDQQVVELFKNYKLRVSLEEVITKPLSKDGIDNFAVTLDEGESFVVVDKRESLLFSVQMPEGRKISESVAEKALQLIDISFNEEHKWRFNDGTSTFQSIVSDQDFIKAIDEQSVNFAKGDLLLVDLKITQHLHVGGIKTSYEVVKVREIINPARQIDLPFE